MKCLCCATALLFLLTTAAAFAQPIDENQLGNWGRWRGPHLNGTSTTADPPVEWGPEKNVKWKVKVPGKGSASPIVWGDKVFVLTAIPKGEEGHTSPHQFTVICYDRATGAEKWRKFSREEVPHESGHETNTFASGSPVTDGKFLYVSFGSYGIYKYDLDGNLQWEKDLGDMKTRMGFGEGASPTLVGNRLVIMWDHEAGSKIYVLDTESGNIVWEKSREEPTTWATALVVEHEGKQQVITNGMNRVRSYDLANGDLLWECGGQVSNPIPTPVVQKQLAIVMTGYRGNAVYAIPLSARGDVTNTPTVAWSRTDAGPYVSSPVLYEGILYYTKERNNILYSMVAETGEKLVDGQRVEGLGSMYSSPVAAAGRVYLSDRNGNTVVIKHGKTYEVLAKNSVGETIDASPAILGKQMFLRGIEHLYCIEQP